MNSSPAAWGKTLVDSLDAGGKRRLAFAAAVLHEPDVLLLDGPTSTVDPLLRHALFDVLEALPRVAPPFCWLRHT